MAEMYASGTGTSKDPSEAIKIYGSLAEQGFPDAMFELAQVHYERRQDYQDSEEALKWYYAAAQKNHAGAQYMLGAVFDSGIISLSHMPAEYKDATYENKDRLAAEWFTRSAEQGHPKAAYELGEHYRGGGSVPADQVLARKWLSISIACGDTGFAKASLGYVAEVMSPEQISRAETLVSEWLKGRAE